MIYQLGGHTRLPDLLLSNAVFHLNPEGAGGTLNSKCEAEWLGCRGVIKGDDQHSHLPGSHWRHCDLSGGQNSGKELNCQNSRG